MQSYKKNPTTTPKYKLVAVNFILLPVKCRHVFKYCQKRGWNTSEPKSLSTSRNELEKLERKAVGEGEGVAV